MAKIVEQYLELLGLLTISAPQHVGKSQLKSQDSREKPTQSADRFRIQATVARHYQLSRQAQVAQLSRISELRSTYRMKG